MINVNMMGRTVRLVKPYTESKRTGINGEFTVKEVLFLMACDRPYKVTKVENGTQKKEHPTDFFLMKATGPIAELFAKYCSATKPDGKLISRRLFITGTEEKYKKTVVDDIPVDLSGVNINGIVMPAGSTIAVKKERTEENSIIMVDSITFLDSNPENQQNNAVTVQTTATVSTPSTVVNVQQPTVQATQPVAAVAQPTVVQTQAAPVESTPVVQTLDGYMNEPVYTPSPMGGEPVAPF